jgi:4a-hydroxytetrahydrobiopterin dehydratase
MPPLADQKCVPCREGTPPLRHDRVATLLNDLPSWSAPKDHHLARRIKTRDFRTALDLVNRIGEVAEEQGHHPELTLGWGFVDARVWTHKIDGLTESDFVLAAKIDRLASDAAANVGHAPA